MYFLVKFVTPEYTSSLLEGELFFKRNEYFIELEKEKNDRVIGDRREGSWSRPLDTSNKKYFVKFEDDEKMYPINITRGAVHKQYKNLKDVPICCFTLLSLKEDFDKVSDNTFKIKDDVIEQFRKEFEDRNVFIFQLLEIMNCIKDYCEKNKIPMKANKVTYYDEFSENHPLSEEEFSDNPIDTLFHKRSSYGSQKEYRIILPGNYEEDQTLKIDCLKERIEVSTISNLESLTFLMTDDTI